MYRSIVDTSRLFVALGAALIVGACASTPNTYSNVDSSVDFTKFKTFTFFEKLATDQAEYESTETRILKASVAREMERRGYSRSAEPDLKINFYINTADKIRSRQTPAAGGYYGYRGARYGAWGGYETRIDQYTEGTLNIDVVDARTDKLVWEGTIVGRITKDVLENLESMLDAAVIEIYKNYPVQ